MNYQKAYMNQIFSSSLMGQVAEMWRNQLLCDAIIRTGTTDTKAHRLVLVAACPMLQSMENAAIGSHLEVRLSPEIKQESVQTFLKYLYEGFMMLTGENYKDIEKIAKILQVESIVRCCVDFSKCLSEKTGVPCEKRFGLSENSDSVYVRSSDLLKVQETVKRHSEEETVSPEGERKRQKINRPTPPPPLLLPMHNLNNERVSSHGIDMSRVSDTDRLMEAEYSPQVIQSSRSSTSEAEIIKDSLEIVHREPPDPNNINQAEPLVQQTMGLSVASKIPSDRNTQIVNMSNALPHSRASSSKNLHIQSSPHSSSSSRKPETAHSLESEPRTPETHKNHDRRHLLTGETHSRHHARQNSHEMPPRKHESYPSNLPTSEILGTPSLHDLSSRSISSPSAVSSQPSSPYRHPIPLSHRQPNAAQIQKSSFLQPLFRPGLPYDGRSYAGVPIGSLSHLAGLLPTSMAPPLPMSYGAEDSIKDHGSGPSVPNSPCTPSGPDLSIIKSEEPRENEELHIDIPEESSTSGAASPHNVTEEEPPGDDSSNQGSDGGSLWQDNSVKDEDESYGIIDLCGVEMAEFKCRYCFSQFSDHPAIMAHFSSVNNHDFSQICPQCYKGFKSSKGYRNHCKMQHTDATDCPSCDICGKRFPAVSNLVSHRRTHSTMRPFHCYRCHKGFKNQYHLKRHVLGCHVNPASKQ